MDQFAHVNGIDLHYLTRDGGDPPLILLHGLTANAHAFDGLVRAGLSPRFRTLSVDLRGRGQSSQPQTGYSLDDHAADILGLMDSQGMEKAVLVGHSFGGLLSVFMAAHHGDRVERMVLMDSGLLHPNVRELIGPSVARLGKAVPSLATYLASVKAQPAYSGWWDADMDAYYRADVAERDDGTVMPISSPAAIAEATDKALSLPWAELFAQAQVPAILINAPGPFGPPGTAAVQPEEQGRLTASLLPDCAYVKVDGNHMTMLYGDPARQIVETIADFVAHSEE